MTMIRALALLGVSLVVFIAGIGLLAINAESGKERVFTNIDSVVIA